MKNLSILLVVLFLNSNALEAQNLNSPSTNLNISQEFEDGITLVSWETFKEVNTSFFVLERSLNHQEFEIINIQKASSSTLGSTQYQFEDVEQFEGNATYRIHLVLMDGNEIVSTLYSPNNSDLVKHINK